MILASYHPRRNRVNDAALSHLTGVARMMFRMIVVVMMGMIVVMPVMVVTMMMRMRVVVMMMLMQMRMSVRPARIFTEDQ
jgi:hypothetical protein